MTKLTLVSAALIALAAFSTQAAIARTNTAAITRWHKKRPAPRPIAYGLPSVGAFAYRAVCGRLRACRTART